MAAEGADKPLTQSYQSASSHDQAALEAKEEDVAVHQWAMKEAGCDDLVFSRSFPEATCLESPRELPESLQEPFKFRRCRSASASLGEMGLPPDSPKMVRRFTSCINMREAMLELEPEETERPQRKSLLSRMSLFDYLLPRSSSKGSKAAASKSFGRGFRRGEFQDGYQEEFPPRVMSVQEFLDPNTSTVDPHISFHRGVFDDWNLRLQVFSATELRAPEYRSFDLIRGLVQGEEALLAEVYIEFELAGRSVKTASTAAMDPDESRSAFFEQEKMLLTYKGERCLRVNVQNKKPFRVLRGDPLIGTGILSLDAEFQDGQSRACVVPIERDGTPSGFVSLECQVVSSSCEAAKTYQALVDGEVAGLREALQAEHNAGNFMETLDMDSLSWQAGCNTESFNQMMAERF